MDEKVFVIGSVITVLRDKIIDVLGHPFVVSPGDVCLVLSLGSSGSHHYSRLLIVKSTGEVNFGTIWAWEGWRKL